MFILQTMSTSGVERVSERLRIAVDYMPKPYKLKCYILTLRGTVGQLHLAYPKMVAKMMGTVTVYTVRLRYVLPRSYTTRVRQNAAVCLKTANDHKRPQTTANKYRNDRRRPQTTTNK